MHAGVFRQPTLILDELVDDHSETQGTHECIDIPARLTCQFRIKADDIEIALDCRCFTGFEHAPNERDVPPDARLRPDHQGGSPNVNIPRNGTVEGDLVPNDYQVAIHLSIDLDLIPDGQ